MIIFRWGIKPQEYFRAFIRFDLGRILGSLCFSFISLIRSLMISFSLISQIFSPTGISAGRVIFTWPSFFKLFFGMGGNCMLLFFFFLKIAKPVKLQLTGFSNTKMWALPAFLSSRHAFSFSRARQRRKAEGVEISC